MGKYLDRLKNQKSPEEELPKLPKAPLNGKTDPFGSLGSTQVESFSENRGRDSPPQNPLRLWRGEGSPPEGTPCYSCHGNDYWQSRITGDAICRKCHPPAPGAELIKGD